MSRYEDAIKLRKILTFDVFNYLQDDCKKHMYDWMQLKSLIEVSAVEEKYYDYSYLISPICKALEGILWNLATELNLKKDTDKLGTFFDEENIEKNFEKLTKLVSDGKKESVRQSLSEIKGLLKRYRHEPSHYGKRVENLEQAEVMANAILHNVKCLISDLIDCGLVSLKSTEDSDEFDLDDTFQ